MIAIKDKIPRETAMIMSINFHFSQKVILSKVLQLLLNSFAKASIEKYDTFHGLSFLI
jgi:NADPH-dependent 7-cyano-7-deazaguanine reductase QueF-like protein